MIGEGIKEVGLGFALDPIRKQSRASVGILKHLLQKMRRVKQGCCCNQQNQQPSSLLARQGTGRFCGSDNSLVFVAVLFCLHPSWSPNGRVQGCYTLKLLLFSRRIPRPACEGQASSPGQRQLFLGSGVGIFECSSGRRAFSQFLILHLNLHSVQTDLLVQR